MLKRLLSTLVAGPARRVLTMYLLLLIVVIGLSVVSSIAIAFGSLSSSPSSHSAWHHFLTTIEGMSHSGLDMVEVVVGALLGALVASMRGGGPAVAPGVVETPAAVEEGDGAEDGAGEGLGEAPAGPPQPLPVAPVAGLTQLDRAMNTLRFFIAVILLLCGALAATGVSYAVVAYRITAEGVGGVETMQATLRTFSTLTGGFLDALEISVGALIGALSSSLSQVVSGR